MRRGLLAVPVCAVLLGLVVPVANGTIVGFPGAGNPIALRLKQRFPHASQRFINCPGENKVVIDEVNGLGCEFRVVSRGRVTRGGAAVLPSRSNWKGARWHVRGFDLYPSAPLTWRSCPTGKLNGEAQSGYRLRTYGVTCQAALHYSFNISLRPLTNNLRLPKHFLEGESGTNTLGFLTELFRCRGRIEIREGNPNPYGHEVASCRTRFGDRFKLSFDQGS